MVLYYEAVDEVRFCFFVLRRSCCHGGKFGSVRFCTLMKLQLLDIICSCSNIVQWLDTLCCCYVLCVSGIVAAFGTKVLTI